MGPYFLAGLDFPEPTVSTTPLADSPDRTVTSLTMAHASATGTAQVSQQIEFSQKLMNWQWSPIFSVWFEGHPIKVGSPDGSEVCVLRLVWRLAYPSNTCPVRLYKGVGCARARSCVMVYSLRRFVQT